MNILMLGNSFTYCNDMAGMLADELGARVTEVVRGGAYLRNFLNVEDELSMLGMNALRGDVREGGERAMCKSFGGSATRWDYVVIQEQSFNAVGNTDDYLRSVKTLCARVREVGAVPVIYESWAYRAGSRKLAGTWLTYDQMRERMLAACTRAADENGALIAKVGEAFAAADFDLYMDDDYHPNAAASRLAAGVIAGAIRAHAERAGQRTSVELRPVTAENWRRCANIRVTPEQCRFVAHNCFSMAQAAYEPDMFPLAIYSGGELVGFTMYGYDKELGMWEMQRLMVDEHHQGRGIGRAAIDALCALVTSRQGHVPFATSAVVGNSLAIGLYERAGFHADGRVIGGEAILIKQL